jgi:hypothetical protein
VEEYGLVSTEERSKDFEGMPITEEEIKKLPKKVSRKCNDGEERR